MSHSRDQQSTEQGLTPTGSAPPTPSAYRPWSAAETPSHHLVNSSYFSAATPSVSRRTHRSTSTAASVKHRSASAASRVYSDAGNDAAGDPENNDDEDDQENGGNSTPSTEEDDEDPLASSEIDPITLKDRQSLMNVQHPFGLPIWKPALYKKSRSVTRHADEALHNVPSAQAERHFTPGNAFWVVFFGWWLSSVCMLISLILYFLPDGGQQFFRLTYGLGWYLFWPFGKYVEGVGIEFEEGEEEPVDVHARADSAGSSGADTIRGDATIRAQTPQTHGQEPSWVPATERTSLLPRSQRASEVEIAAPSKSYGATSIPEIDKGVKGLPSSNTLGKIAFWLSFVCIVAPLLLTVCLICWGLVVTVPMAKLNWQLVKHLWQHPHSIRFCSAPKTIFREAEDAEVDEEAAEEEGGAAAAPGSQISVKRMRLAAGQAAPGPAPSTVLLCTYHAAGLEYYKYTLGGVNIMFVNLLGVVLFVLFDGYVIMEHVEEKEKAGEHVSAVLAAIGSRGVVFFLSLLSIIPLSYFIGMAVASISAQSSIGMGAVINATFGSLIEIILYGMMLAEGKGLLVEGSIVGSLLAGVLLMPGLSMVSSALKRKEQRFNAKSAGVTSMMLIMAIIGILAPTLFYQTYGNFQLICTGCPGGPASPDRAWKCDHCYYEHPDPVSDPFYQSTVKSLMYFCAFVLILSYLIGLWFSLRTHASQIWQNPQQALHPPAEQLPPPSTAGGLVHRISLYNKLKSPSTSSSGRRPSGAGLEREPSVGPPGHATQGSHQSSPHQTVPSIRTSAPPSPTLQRHISFSQAQPLPTPSAYTPVMESVDAVVKQQQPGLKIPDNMSAEEFTRAVAVATVSALRHQQANAQKAAHKSGGDGQDAGGHGGHDAPNWSRKLSASVLLGCTVLYAVIAELLVDCVDVILGDSSGSEKFLGITLFALAPNTTEFMNAISFALNGNIALSMEIGSAYALQVCLLQIPAMVAFSAWYNPEEMGKVAKTFTLIFPRWDVVVLILSMFLMTYTYIEARSNYHRGSILILSYVVLVAGFYFAPIKESEDTQGTNNITLTSQAKMFTMTLWEMTKYNLAKLW